MAAEVKVRIKDMWQKRANANIPTTRGRNELSRAVLNCHWYISSFSYAKQICVAMTILFICLCRVSLRVTQRRQRSGQCNSAVRTFSSTPPGWSGMQTTSTTIYCSVKHHLFEMLPKLLPPPAPILFLPPVQPSQLHHSCLSPDPQPPPYRPERETRAHLQQAWFL